jgi:hypothetical protein
MICKSNTGSSELLGKELTPLGQTAAEPAEPYGQTVHIHFLKAMHAKEDAPKRCDQKGRGGWEEE